MNLTFKSETFRDDYTFRNSPETIRRFPFPFNEDKYMYSVNMEPHVPAGPEGGAFRNLVDIDEHFVAEMQDRDVRITQCITDAKGDRSRHPGAQVDRDQYVHVVDRGPDGVVIRGAKAHQTGPR